MDDNNTQTAQLVSPNRYDDEIDLIELFAALWRGKWIVVGVTLVCVLAALAYAMTAPDVYKLEASIAPPLPADISPIQPPGAVQERDRYSLASVETGQVFEMVKGYLTSNEVRQYVWADFHGVNPAEIETDESLKASYNDFNDNLKIDQPKNQTLVQISMETSETEKDKAIVNRLLTTTDQWVITEFVTRLKKALSVLQEKLEEDIEQLRKTHHLQQQDEIKQLQEAYNIAEKLGIKKTPYNELANIELKVVENPYLLGTITLQSQIDALKARQGDDAFVPNLRNLQARLSQVTADMLRVDDHFGEASSFILLKPVSSSVNPIKPKKMLIMVASVFIGGILGIFAVFILNLWGRVSERV